MMLQKISLLDHNKFLYKAMLLLRRFSHVRLCVTP